MRMTTLKLVQRTGLMRKLSRRMTIIQINTVFRVPANISTTIMSETEQQISIQYNGTRYLIFDLVESTASEVLLCMYGNLLLLYVLFLLIVMLKALKTHLK